MKCSVLLGLLGCVMVSACGGAAVNATKVAKLAPVLPRVCGGPVTIRSESDVRSIGALCDSIDGDLRIVGAAVRSLDGLESLRSVRYLVVAQNAKLESVRGLRGLRSARGVNFIDNPALTSLSGLEGLTELEAAVVANSGITSLAGLGQLRSARDVVIVGNPRLDGLSGLSGLGALESVESLDVERNGEGEPAVRSASAGHETPGDSG